MIARRLAIVLVACALVGRAAGSEEKEHAAPSHDAAPSHEAAPAAAPAPAALPPGPLATLVSGLQHLQDQAAAGDWSAVQAQPAALKSVAIAIDSSGPEMWKDKGELVAAAIYLLSGGSPGPLQRRLPDDVLASEDGALIRAALAYAAGRHKEAKALFEHFDVAKIDKRVAGQFAYARADLIARDDETQALKAFDLARLLAPGGVIEEASLRREIRIAGASRDFDRFCLLADQYARRFPRSVYRNNFEQIFFSSFEQILPKDGEEKPIERFLALSRALPAATRRRALLSMARAAMLNGRPQVASVFARAVMREASPESGEHATARLYEDAAKILTLDNSEAAKDLQSLSADRFDRDNGALLAAARKLADDLAQEVTIPNAAGDDKDDNQTIKSAEEALQRSSSLLVPAEGGAP